MSATAIDLDRLLKLRVAVARVGEGELAGNGTDVALELAKVDLHA